MNCKIPLEDYVRQTGIALKPQGDELLGRCPAHDDTGSKAGHLYINPKKQVFHCAHCGWKGGDTIDYVMKLDGIGFKDACAKLGIEGNGTNGYLPHAPAQEECRYVYEDAQGNALRIKIRYHDKRFSQRTPDGGTDLERYRTCSITCPRSSRQPRYGSSRVRRTPTTCVPLACAPQPTTAGPATGPMITVPR